MTQPTPPPSGRGDTPDAAAPPATASSPGPTPPPVPPLPAGAVDAGGRLVCAVVCRRCRYALRGLRPDAACPECGEPIPATLRSEVADRVEAIVKGARWVLIGEGLLLVLIALLGTVAAGGLGRRIEALEVLGAPVFVLCSAAVVATAYGIGHLLDGARPLTPREHLGPRLVALGLLVWGLAGYTLLLVLFSSSTLRTDDLENRVVVAVLSLVMPLPLIAACDLGRIVARDFVATRRAKAFARVHWLAITPLGGVAAMVTAMLAGFDTPGAWGYGLAYAGLVSATLLGIAVVWSRLRVVARRCLARLRDPAVPFDETGWASTVPPLLRIPALPAGALDPEGRLACALECRGCKYAMRSLFPDAACPECGKLIASTLRAETLGRAEALAAGARWMLVAGGLTLTFIALTSGLAMIDLGRFSPVRAVLGIIAVVLVTMMVLVFVHSISKVQAGLPTPRGDRWLRIVLAVLSGWIVIAPVLEVALVNYGFTQNHGARGAVGRALIYLFLLMPLGVAAASGMRGAQCFGAARNARLFQYLCWMTILALAVMALAAAVSLIGFAFAESTMMATLGTMGGVTFLGLALAWLRLGRTARRCVVRMRDPGVPFERTGWVAAIPALTPPEAPEAPDAPRPPAAGGPGEPGAKDPSEAVR